MAATHTPLPPYPEGTAGFDNVKGTFWPNLTPANASAFHAVQKWVNDNHIDLHELNMYAIDHRLTILRYLRANNFDSKKAIAHMSDNLTWRRDMKVADLVTKRPEEILGYPVERLTSMYAHWHYGYDKTGRPVVYQQYGKFDATELKKMSNGSYDPVVKYHVWYQEACLKLAMEQSQKTGKIVETVTGIVDVKDMTMSQVTRDFMAIIKLFSEIDQKQYPETLGRMYIINAPMLFPMVWKLVKPWLDVETTKKIFILGGRREYEPVLRDFIGKENLPLNYGGDLPPLTPLIHPFAETMQRDFSSPHHISKIAASSTTTVTMERVSITKRTDSPNHVFKFESMKEEIYEEIHKLQSDDEVSSHEDSFEGSLV